VSLDHHFSAFFARAKDFLDSNGITIFFVFDGCMNPLKASEDHERVELIAHKAAISCSACNVQKKTFLVQLFPLTFCLQS
jgi:hypothetical protein